MRNQAGFFVYTVSERPGGPAQAVPRPVAMLFEYETFVAIRPDGLAEGDLVITEGNERLFPMTSVAVIEDAEEPASGERTGSDGSGPASAAAPPRKEGD